MRLQTLPGPKSGQAILREPRARSDKKAAFGYWSFAILTRVRAQTYTPILPLYWGLWLCLDPTGAPLLLRDIGTDDIYALSLDRK